ncbi:MAG: aminopeptidase P family protein [Lachnospiraceae bacterium]|nr:aminopeptidase P family protein [Lachnospiraceae bacterium]
MDNSNIVDLRIKKLRELMSENDISFYIIPTSDPHGSEYIDNAYKTREYMSGFTGSAGTLIVSKNEAALFVDGRYHIQADLETKETCISVYKLGIDGVPSVKEYLNNQTVPEDRIGFDGRLMMEDVFESINGTVDATFDCELNLVRDIYENIPKSREEKIIILDDEITGESCESKIEKVRIFIKEKDADGLFLSSLDDICYVFNIRGSDIAYNTVAYSYAYITRESATLYLKRNAYDESTTKSFDLSSVNIANYEEIEEELYKIKGKKILLDKEYTSCLFYKALSVGNEVISIKNYDVIKKYIKNEIEQKHARNYAIADAVALIEYIVSLKSSIHEGFEVDEYFAKEYLTSFRANMKGFYCLSFDTICGYKENGAIVHYSVNKDSAKELENNGLLLVDSGAHYMGATTDVTRTIPLGELSDEERAAYTVVLKGNLKLMDAIFLKGTRCENLDILARESLWKIGLDYRHGTGHGIGSFLNVHEGPIRIGYKIREDMPQPELTPGMILSDEPGYYAAGKFGIRHETQLLCVKKYETEYGEFYGFEPLTLVPFEKDAICFELLTAEEFDILKRYSDLIREKVMPYLSEDGKKWLDYNTNFID